VLAHRCTWDDGSLLAVHNLGPESISVPLKLADCDDSHRLDDLLGRAAPTLLDAAGTATLQLEGYGYRWLRIIPVGSRRLT